MQGPSFRTVESIHTDQAGCRELEREFRRLFIRTRNEWYAELASRLRQWLDELPWVRRVVEEALRVRQK